MSTDVLDGPGSTFRRQRWLDAGSPAADLSRLSFAGADSVRWILERALRQLPGDVRHFCVEAIDWAEVGRDAHAWAHHAPAPRALAGDVGHRVALNGRVRDESLPGLIAHEVSHRWRSPIRFAAPPLAPMGSVDMLAVRLCAESHMTPDEQAYDRACYVGQLVAEELRADEQARAWGFDWPGHDPDVLRRRFGGKYDEARRLARLAAEHDEDNLAAQIAATNVGPPL